MKKVLYIFITCIVLLASCKEASVPSQFSEVGKQASIYPDYKDVVIPPNIAPMNFQVKDAKAGDFVVEFKAPGSSIVVGGFEDGVIEIDSTEWRQLLRDNKGKDISVSVYANEDGNWVKFKDHKLTVAEEPIDPFLSYRLIEPGYELYRQVGLYQRNLTDFSQVPIYENNRKFEEDNNHCVNCHNYQNYSTKNMLFHVRAKHGGTMIIKDGVAKKVAIKDSLILTAGVYPSWNPKRNLVAFSTNKTAQIFHMYHPEKIEVFDSGSDLLLYDADKNEVRHILRTPGELETFPNWSPDGKTIYYCVADASPTAEMPDSLKESWIVQHYDSLFYNIKKVNFDERSMSFSQPEMVVDAAESRNSCTLPRVSPDGRYLLFTVGKFGQFHIWHKSSDLWVKNLQNDSIYPLKEANSPDVDSYHTWSSNGRWIVFSSRRMDGNYTRMFICYFDKQGRAHKAFCLPQEDPRQNVMLLRSYNVPELTKDAVRIDPEEIKKAVYDQEPETARYIGQ